MTNITLRNIKIKQNWSMQLRIFLLQKKGKRSGFQSHENLQVLL